MADRLLDRAEVEKTQKGNTIPLGSFIGILGFSGFTIASLSRI